MKLSTLLLSSLFAVTAVPAAHATVLTYDFTAKVDYLTGDGGTGRVPGILAGTHVSMGDLITGRFQFDDAALQAAIGAGPTTPDFSVTLEPVSFNYSITSIGFSAQTTSTSIRASRSGDADWFDVLTVDGGALASVMMLDNGSSAATPRYAIETAHFDSAFFQMLYSVDKNHFWIGADLISLEQSAPIPEPSSLALFTLGAGLTACATRRRKRAHANAA